MQVCWRFAPKNKNLAIICVISRHTSPKQKDFICFKILKMLKSSSECVVNKSLCISTNVLPINTSYTSLKADKLNIFEVAGEHIPRLGLA